MPSTRTLACTGATKAMTLDELAAFVQDALRAGAAGSEAPKVRLNLGGTIKSASIEITKTAAPADTKDRS